MAANEDPRALDLLAFWWRSGPARWFSVDPEFDESCRGFEPLHEEAVAGRLEEWRQSAPGTLALILLTDQIPRNVFRGTRRAFASDAQALAYAEQAKAEGLANAYPAPANGFFHLPFMHAENLAAQNTGLDLYRAAGDRDAYFFALVHHDAIRRFGRFPHRNAILGRETTAEEQAYLDSGGFSA